MNIGLLEDDADTAEYLAIALDMAGHIVHTYADGSTFLQTLFAAQGQPAPLPYDLLLVDLTLAGTMSGQEVIEGRNGLLWLALHCLHLSQRHVRLGGTRIEVSRL